MEIRRLNEEEKAKAFDVLRLGAIFGPLQFTRQTRQHQSA